MQLGYIPQLLQVEKERWLFSINRNSSMEVLSPLCRILKNKQVIIRIPGHKKGDTQIIRRVLRTVQAIPSTQETVADFIVTQKYGSGVYELKRSKINSTNSCFLLPRLEKWGVQGDDRLVILDYSGTFSPIWKEFEENAIPRIKSRISAKKRTDSPFQSDNFPEEADADQNYEQPAFVRVDPADKGFCGLCNVEYQCAIEHRYSNCHRTAAFTDKLWSEVDLEIIRWTAIRSVDEFP